MQESDQISCIGFWSEYDQCFFEKATLPGYSIKVLNPARVLARYISPSLLVKPLRTFLLKRIARSLLKAHQGDIVIVHDERVMVSALLAAGDGINAHLLVRNIIDDNSKLGEAIQALKNGRLPIWSFDQGDCQRYQFRHYNQFISKLDGYEDTPILYDFGFLGKDKGRKAILENIREKVTALGFSCEIDIRVGARRKGTGLLDKPYTDYLAQLCSARCIIDIIQGSQSGITLRPLEAALYQRKLLTNNPEVMQLPFYHPGNIFILGQDPDNQLANFMGLPLNPVSKKALSPYLTSSLITEITNYQVSK